MILTKGTRLGPYEIVAPIEAGGMGSVYKARDTRLSRSVALKVLPVASLQDERLVKRFELEARAAAALTHPNVVAVYDVGEEEVTLPTPFGNETVRLRFLVEEYVEGHSLRKLLRGPRPSLKRIVDIGTGITKGLVAAHEKGLLHRDLKPENILIDLKGNAKIADFGLVRWIYPDTAAPVNDSVGIDPLTRTGFIVGTLGYMSPEQAKGETLGAPSDLFVFGILLYEMITGQAPFARDDVDEVFKAILRENPTPVLDIAPGAPPRLAAIVDRLLAKTTAQRYRSASEVLSDFDRLAEEIRRKGSGSGERPQDPISLAPGVSARRETPPLVYLVTAVAVMVAFAGGLAVATARARSRPVPPHESGPGGWEAPSRWHASLVSAPETAGGTLLDVLPLASGDLVVTLASGDGSDLFLVSAPGGSGDLIRISSPDSGGRAPAVSADGTRIVFSGGRDGHRGGLHEAALSSLAAGSRPLLGEGEEPALSPDGASLAYVVRSEGRTELLLASADGESPRRLHEAPSRELHFPAFSRDGRGLVVLETARGPEGSGAGSAGAAANAVLLWIPLPGPGPAIPLSTERFAVARPGPLASGEFLLRTAGTSAGLIVPREGAPRRAPFGAALSILAASPDASRVATRGEGGPLVVWTSPADAGTAASGASTPAAAR